MANQAWAAEIVTKNFQAILSEAGSNFDREFLERWVLQNGDGYFIRDSGCSLDCALVPKDKFDSLYMFESGDVDALFRLITRV